MKKIFAAFAVLAGLSSAAQADMVLDVISEQQSQPGLKIVAAGEFDERFDRILHADMLVAAKFDLGSKTPEFTLSYEIKTTAASAWLYVRLLDANGQKRFERSFSGSSSGKIFLSHAAVAALHKALGLADLDWMNKKLLITRKTASKQSQIIEADYTLSYQKVLRQGGLSLFGKWASAAQNGYFYSDYNKDELMIFKVNLSDGKRELVAKGSGMLALSDLRAHKALVTKTYGDQPEIALIDLANGSERRLTNYAGIDVSARFFGESEMVFISDRGGSPNIYLQEISGKTASRLVYHGKNNSSFGVWGEYIAYSSRDKTGDFNLFLMNTATSNVRQLTLNGKNVFPNFSHDGRTLLFIKYLGNESSVGILRLDENKAFFFPMRIGRISTLDW